MVLFDLGWVIFCTLSTFKASFKYIILCSDLQCNGTIKLFYSNKMQLLLEE